MDPGDPCKDFHLWYYDSRVWQRTSFLGVPTAKFVSDLWNYQEILFEVKPSLVVEFGTYMGGSALWFSLLANIVRPGAKVLTVDIDHRGVAPEVRINADIIELMTCSSTDPRVADRIRQLRAKHPGPVFAILDSEHRMDHVLAEMKLLRPLLVRGDYLVVEDSNVNGHPVWSGYGPGPYEAIEAYFLEFPDDYEVDRQREKKFGFTTAPGGFLIRRS